MLYDWIGWRKILPGTRELDLVTDEAGQPLKSRFHHAFEYSDCFADDARLVVLNAVDAAERGAVIRTRTRCVRAERGTNWRLVLNARGQRDVVTARVLVNAAGAWSEVFAETALRTDAAASAASRQRQSYRGAQAVTITTAPISCKRPTAASSSPFRSSATSR